MNYDEGITVSDENNQITIDDVKTLFALHGKNAGCSLKLQGKVVLIAFLINDGESSWDSASEKAVIEMLESASLKLMTDSGLNKKQFQVAYAYCQVSVPYVVNRQTSHSCVFDVLRQFGYENVQDYQRHYEKKFIRDETAISFVFNKDFRSYAHSVDKARTDYETECPNGDEYSMVSFQRGDLAGAERSFLHELMHQFGAIDYYYPEYLKFKAEKLLPGSIMNGGTIIDDLTRYIIGWDEKPSSKAVEFLNEIKSISAEEIEFALRQEWKKTDT